jgi:hypothetical protein
MTEPGFVAPTTPGWWVRTNRIGTGKTGINVATTAVGGRPSRGRASGSYGWVGSASGHSRASFAGANVAADTSVPIPTHVAGNLIVIFARNSGATTPGKPSAGGTVPAWVNGVSGGSSFALCRTVSFVATANNHTSGVWTNTDGLIAVVITAPNASTPIGGQAVGTTASTANICTAPAVTMTNTDGTSILLHFFGWGDGSNPVTSISATAPAGYTQRVQLVDGANLIGLCLDTKNVTTTDGAVNQSSNSSPWYTGATVEILS